MKWNYQQFQESYKDELQRRKVEGIAPAIMVNTGTAGMQCLVPVRIVGMLCRRKPELTGAVRLRNTALQHELTFGVQVDRHNKELFHETVAEHMNSQKAVKGIRITAVSEVAARLRRISDGGMPVSCHIGTMLAQYDGPELPAQVADAVMNTLHHMEMAGQAGK